MKIRKNNLGFTAIELSVAMAIVLIVSIAGFAVYKNQNKSKQTTNPQAQTNTQNQPQKSSLNVKLFLGKKKFEIKEWNVQALKYFSNVEETTTHFSYEVGSDIKLDGSKIESIRLVPAYLDDPKLQYCLPMIERYNYNESLVTPKESYGEKTRIVGKHYYIYKRSNGICGGSGTTYLDSAVLTYAYQTTKNILSSLEPLSGSN